MSEPLEQLLHVRGTRVDIHPGCSARRLPTPPDLRASDDMSTAPVPSLIPAAVV